MLIQKEDIGLQKNTGKKYKEQFNSLSSDQLEISIDLCLGDDQPPKAINKAGKL